MANKLFKAYERDLEIARQSIENWGVAYIHGDGQVYRDENSSDTHKHFTNPLPGKNPPPHPATYRMKYTSVDQVPKTVEALIAQLEAAKQQDYQKQAEDTTVEKSLITALPAKKSTEAVAEKSAASGDAERLAAENAELRAQLEALKKKKPGRPPADSKDPGPEGEKETKGEDPLG